MERLQRFSVKCAPIMNAAMKGKGTSTRLFYNVEMRATWAVRRMFAQSDFNIGGTAEIATRPTSSIASNHEAQVYFSTGFQQMNMPAHL